MYKQRRMNVTIHYSPVTNTAQHVHTYWHYYTRTRSIDNRGCPRSWEAYKVGLKRSCAPVFFLQCGTQRSYGGVRHVFSEPTTRHRLLQSELSSSIARCSCTPPHCPVFIFPPLLFCCRCHTTSSTLRGQPLSTLTSSAEEENSPRACSLVCSTSSRCVHAWLNTCTCIHVHVHPSPPPSHSPFPSPLRLLSLILLSFLVALLNVDYITNANQLAFPHVV